MKSIELRAYRAMAGLAIGDALSWPALFHRSLLLPPWTRRIRREMDAAMESSETTRLPLPFSLNQPAAAFETGPADDSEWAAFTALRLLETGGQLNRVNIADSWMALAKSPETVRGPVSVQSALANLRRGILPPASGHDNPHYFDDAALCRAVPIGIICTGYPEKAAELAGLEAEVTQSEDGLWATQAFAAAVSLACAGGNAGAAVDAAVNQLPADTWIRRRAQESLRAAREADSLLTLLSLLNGTIVNREYSYGSAAPETLAVTLAIVQHCGGDFEQAVTAACAVAKTADSVPAQVGALCGALAKRDILPESWRKQITHLKGICLPSLAGMDYLDLSRRLAVLAAEIE